MEKQSRNQLLLVVERQEEQLKRYEARLRDVVQAYKGLQKEKVALEKSLKVLSPERKGGLPNDSLNDLAKPQPAEQPTKPEPKEYEIKTTSELSTTCDAVSGTPQPCELSDKKDNTSTQSNLQAQVETLRETLKTVMEQKSKMENSFQADKKKYLQEIQKKEEAFDEERDEFLKEKGNLQQEIKELRNRTRNEQQARESEQNDHAMMLKEMQMVVSKERISKEELQTKLDHLNQVLAERGAQSSSGGPAEQESSEKNTAPLDEAQASSENADTKTGPTLLQLQEEMGEMRSRLEKDIFSEQLRANEAEARATLIAKVEEQRVADLEAKLSELSDVVGKYERLRSHDQIEIQKLKERLYALNTASRGSDNTDNRNAERETGADNESDLNEVFRKVKDILRSRTHSNDDVLSDMTGFSKAELECILKNDPAHKACQDELRQLKDEFERYKSKVQTIRKTKLESETVTRNETTDKLRSQITSLRGSVDSLQRELDSKETEHRSEIERSSREIADLRVKHSLELENERTVYLAKLQELESQVRNQRSRTLSLISEKDCEIERLKSKLSESSPSSDFKKGHSAYRRTSSSDNAVKELLSQSSPSPFVHYAQEQAFCEAELELLRKKRSELEDTIRDITHREEQASEQIEFLKEEIRKLERNRSRENANLEYLKNVILRYLLTDSDSVRQQMVAAISAILEFSPKELSSVKRKSKTWWSR